MWLVAPDGTEKLAWEGFQPPDSHLEPPWFRPAAGHTVRYEGVEMESTPPPPKDVSRAPREIVMQALGELVGITLPRYECFPTKDAIRIGDQLLVDLGLAESIYDAVHPDDEPEPNEAPQWFLDWRMSQYNSDLLELVADGKKLAHGVADSLNSYRLRLDRVEEQLGDFKLTKEAQARIDRRIAEQNESDRHYAAMQELGEYD
jgi:hypothetical protein